MTDCNKLQPGRVTKSPEVRRGSQAGNRKRGLVSSLPAFLPGLCLRWFNPLFWKGSLSHRLLLKGIRNKTCWWHWGALRVNCYPSHPYTGSPHTPPPASLTHSRREALTSFFNGLTVIIIYERCTDTTIRYRYRYRGQELADKTTSIPAVHECRTILLKLCLYGLIKYCVSLRAKMQVLAL